MAGVKFLKCVEKLNYGSYTKKLACLFYRNKTKIALLKQSFLLLIVLFANRKNVE